MYGKKVKLRAIFILSIFFSLVLIIFLVFKSLEENVVYFKSPTEIKNLTELTSKKIRTEFQQNFSCLSVTYSFGFKRKL